MELNVSIHYYSYVYRLTIAHSVSILFVSIFCYRTSQNRTVGVLTVLISVGLFKTITPNLGFAAVFITKYSGKTCTSLYTDTTIFSALLTFSTKQELPCTLQTPAKHGAVRVLKAETGEPFMNSGLQTKAIH